MGQASPDVDFSVDLLSHPTRDDRRVDLDGQVTLHYPDLDDRVTERTQNISSTGMFVRTVALRPPGTVLRFELDLANGLEPIEGRAEVVWARRQDDGLFRPAGMGVRFLELDRQSCQLISWSVKHRTRELRKFLHLDAVATEPADVSDLHDLQTELEDALGTRTESSALAELRAEVDQALKEVLPRSLKAGADKNCEYLRSGADPRAVHPYAGCATAHPPAGAGRRLWRFASLPLVPMVALGIYFLSPTSQPASATPQTAQAPAAQPIESVDVALAEIVPAQIAPAEIAPAGTAPAGTAPAPATGETAEAQPSVEHELEQLTHAWAAAWSQQRASVYLAFYASDFEPPNGLDRATWEAQREERILKPRSIQVEVSNLESQLLSTQHARVSFAQIYRSDRYQDTVHKTLELIRGEQGWRILAESSEPAA